MISQGTAAVAEIEMDSDMLFGDEATGGSKMPILEDQESSSDEEEWQYEHEKPDTAEIVPAPLQSEGVVHTEEGAAQVNECDADRSAEATACGAATDLSEPALCQESAMHHDGICCDPEQRQPSTGEHDSTAQAEQDSDEAEESGDVAETGKAARQRRHRARAKRSKDAVFAATQVAAAVFEKAAVRKRDAHVKMEAARMQQMVQLRARKGALKCSRQERQRLIAARPGGRRITTRRLQRQWQGSNAVHTMLQAREGQQEQQGTHYSSVNKRIDWGGLVCTMAVTAMVMMTLTALAEAAWEDSTIESWRLGAAKAIMENWSGAPVAAGLMWVVTWLTGMGRAIIRHRGGQCWRLMFGWLIWMNTWYWNRALLKEWKFQSQNSVQVQLVDEQGEEWTAHLMMNEEDEDESVCCAIDQEAYTPLRAELDTEFGSDNPILDSGCGPSIYPRSWLQRLGEHLKLRPANTRLRAANGGAMGIAGCITMKFRVPGTVEWIPHEVLVAEKGDVPDHVHILGNDFLDKIKGRIDYSMRKLTGTTPQGTHFEAPIKYGGESTASCNAVEQEQGGEEVTPIETWENDEEDEGAVLLLQACVFEAQKPQLVKVKAWAVPDGSLLEWEPVRRIAESDALVTQGGFVEATNGEIAYWIMNTGDEPITLPAGSRIAKLTPVTSVPTGEILGHAERSWCMHDIVFTSWIAAQVITAVSGLWQINHMLWRCVMTNLVLCFCLAALITVGRNKTVDSWVHSIHEPAKEDATATRQTTVRHRARTRLNTDDIRRVETGQESVKRLRKEMQKQKRLAAEYDAWQKQIGSKFKFGSNLTMEEKDDLCVLLFVYKEMFIENTKAPPAIDGIEYALYFRYNDPIPVRRRVPRLSPIQMAHMEKETAEMLRNHIIEFSDSDWATAPVFAKKRTARCDTQ